MTSSTTQLNLTKPVTTQDGRPVRIICTNRNLDGYGPSLIGLITQPNGHEQIRNYKFDGTPIYGDDRDRIINPKKKLYLLVWEGASGETCALYKTEEARAKAIKTCATYSWKVYKTLEVEID